MCVILLGCFHIWHFHHTLFRGLLFSGHSVETQPQISYIDSHRSLTTAFRICWLRHCQLNSSNVYRVQLFISLQTPSRKPTLVDFHVWPSCVHDLMHHCAPATSLYIVRFRQMSGLSSFKNF